MRKKQLKRMIAGIWTAVFVAMGSMTAFAAGDSVTVEGNGSDAAGTQVVAGYQDKDLFSNMKNLVPGDTISNTVTLSNKSSRAVTIYMKAFSEFTSEDGVTAVREGSEAFAEGKTFRKDLLDQIEMSLKLGDQIIYRGSADGNAPAEGYQALTAGDYGLSLGSFEAGQTEELVVTLTLPGHAFDNTFADRFDAVDWVFCVEGTTPTPPDPDPGPKPDPDPNPDPRPDPRPDPVGPDDGDGDSEDDGDYNPPITIIPDPEVPLGPYTGGSGDSNVLILDEDVPLASLPKMGDAGIHGYVFGILLVLLAASGAVYLKKRLNRS